MRFPTTVWAEAIWRAAADPSAPLRILAGADAEAWMKQGG
jgi:hypothetical protein